MKIIRNVSGMELAIELTQDEINAVIAEHAVITVKPVAVLEPKLEAKPVSEPKKFTMPKVTRAGTMVDHMEDVRQMVEQDIPYTQIASYFGVSLSTVNKYIKMWGFHRPGASHAPKGMTMGKAFDLLERYQNGETLRSLAKAFHIKEEAASYWMNKAKAEVA